MLGGPWVRKCRRLFLSHNQIGDAGMCALAEALRRGHALGLEHVDLRVNPASAAAKQAVRDAIDELLASGKMDAREVRVSGTPDEAARFIQRKVRLRLATLAVAIAAVTVPMAPAAAP